MSGVSGCTRRATRVMTGVPASELANQAHSVA